MASIPWTLKRLLIILPAMVIGVIGKVAFLIPYHLTGRLARLGQPLTDQISTHKLLYGMGANLLWLIVLGIISWLAGGWLVALVVVIGTPLAALVALWTTEQWAQAEHDVRRFFLVRRQSELIDQLKTAQRDIANRLRDFQVDWDERHPGELPAV